MMLTLLSTAQAGGSLSATLVAGLVTLPIALAFDPHQKPAPEVQQSGSPAVLRGRVTSKDGAPLAGARVRVAVPAADMRFIDGQQASPGL